MTNESFPVTPENKVRQIARKAKYEKAEVYRVLDQGLIGHVCIALEEDPVVIPMFYARDGENLIFHGSTKSRLMVAMASGIPVRVSVALLDGIVLAKSLLHHSMNYRSVNVVGTGIEIKEREGKLAALKVVSDRIMPGRWDDARQPYDNELKATCVVAVNIQTGSAKISQGGPSDDEADRSLLVWAGVVPLETTAKPPITHEDSTNEIPPYVGQWIEQFNRPS